LASSSCGRAPNLPLRNFFVGSVGRLYSHDSMPSANMFFARSASLRVRSRSSSALTVMLVSGSECTW
jgi:hypothetical protein